MENLGARVVKFARLAQTLTFVRAARDDRVAMGRNGDVASGTLRLARFGDNNAKTGGNHSCARVSNGRGYLRRARLV